MIKSAVKKLLAFSGSDINKIAKAVSHWSLALAIGENRYGALIERLRRIVPDVSAQYSGQPGEFNDYWELKLRGLHAFQCSLMLKALEGLSEGRKITVVDIGDSAGTHMLYLKNLAKEKFDIDTLSVNLDQRAIDKIKAKGLNAMLCRAENLDISGNKPDLFVTFEMLEHLHNPAIFFHRLAKRAGCGRMVISVPYMKSSRIGLHNIRSKQAKTIFAEDEHLFELSPEDWSLLMLHSGWRVVYSKVYYQYPRKLPIIKRLLAPHWMRVDFEGFWGAVLERDMSFSDLYKDWEE